MFENHRIFKTKLAGRDLIVETGKFAQLANGSCLVRYGDTVVNVAVTASQKPRDGIDFFPLSVDLKRGFMLLVKYPVRFQNAKASLLKKPYLLLG